MIYPVAGEATLLELAREAKAERAVFNSKVRTVLRGSYSHYYRRLLPDLLASLGVREVVVLDDDRGQLYERHVQSMRSWRPAEAGSSPGSCRRRCDARGDAGAQRH
ncbi:MAG: hypothetical protein WAK86_12180 [Pseudonocardiaceae bacterium]